MKLPHEARTCTAVPYYGSPPAEASILYDRCSGSMIETEVGSKPDSTAGKGRAE